VGSGLRAHNRELNGRAACDRASLRHELLAANAAANFWNQRGAAGTDDTRAALYARTTPH